MKCILSANAFFVALIFYSSASLATPPSSPNRPSAGSSSSTSVVGGHNRELADVFTTQVTGAAASSQENATVTAPPQEVALRVYLVPLVEEEENSPFGEAIAQRSGSGLTSRAASTSAVAPTVEPLRFESDPVWILETEISNLLSLGSFQTDNDVIQFIRELPQFQRYELLELRVSGGTAILTIASFPTEGHNTEISVVYELKQQPGNLDEPHARSS